MRPLFPSRTVALHERLNEGSSPHLCQVEVPTGVDDGEGGETVSWDDLADPLPCRVSPVGSAVERVQAEQIQGFSRYTVAFERATIIPGSARLRIEIGEETLLLDPHGANGPRSYEAQRKYECSLWAGAT